MSIKQHNIGRAKLVKIERDVQTYEYLDGERKGKRELIWGWNLASNVNVGDTGMMVYESTNSYGLPFFIKDKV